MLSQGVCLQGRYTIQRMLGQGGMGGVYLALHQGLDAQVAVKEMLLDTGDAGAIAQFKREAQLLHQLQHPNLPRVHDFFEEGGRYYLVMDYVDGRTLDRVVDDGPVSQEEALRWAASLCDVLGYLHDYTPPIIFKDLKPSNIMLTRDGRIKLIDFGIAKELDRATGGGTRTSVKGAGTPGFAAPEQYGSGTEVRTDVYALGATLWCLLTRRLPPDSTDVAAGVAELEPLEALRPDLSPALCRAVARMMAIKRSERPATMRDVSQMLAGVTQAGPLEAATVVPAAVSALTDKKTADAAQPTQLATPLPAGVPARSRAWLGPVLGMAVLAAGGLAWAGMHRAPATQTLVVSPSPSVVAALTTVPPPPTPSAVAAVPSHSPPPRPSQVAVTHLAPPHPTPAQAPHPSAPPAWLDPNTDIVPGQRIGSIVLRMSSAEAAARWGLNPESGKPGRWAGHRRGFLARHGSIVSTWVDDPVFKVSGVHAGASAADVTRRLGPPQVHDDRHLGYPQKGVSFVLSGGRVSSIAVFLPHSPEPRKPLHAAPQGHAVVAHPAPAHPAVHHPVAHHPRRRRHRR